MSKYTSTADITPISISRIGTGYQELDWLYGFSESHSGLNWGMPMGTLSNWIGEGGVGKSRLAISVAREKVSSGSSVLYFQNEVDLPTFASWVGMKSDKFFCSEARILSEQLHIVKELSPSLVIVDSINLIHEFGSGRDENIRNIVESYRDAIKSFGSHVIFLCQLNKDGSPKGSTALTHMPDINFILTNNLDGSFDLAVDKKHRYGRTGDKFFSTWRHVKEGVVCISKNREKDEMWSGPDLGLDLESCPLWNMGSSFLSDRDASFMSEKPPVSNPINNPVHKPSIGAVRKDPHEYLLRLPSWVPMKERKEKLLAKCYPPEMCIPSNPFSSTSQAEFEVYQDRIRGCYELHNLLCSLWVPNSLEEEQIYDECMRRFAMGNRDKMKFF